MAQHKWIERMPNGRGPAPLMAVAACVVPGCSFVASAITTRAAADAIRAHEQYRHRPIPFGVDVADRSTLIGQGDDL